MVVLRGVGDAEADRHDIEEFGLAEVGADMEGQFVVALADFFGSEHGRIGPAIVVGGQRFDEFAGWHAAEFDLHTRGGAAARGIEDVCAYFAHRISCSRKAAILWITSNAIFFSVSASFCKRRGKASRMASFLFMRAQIIKGKPNFSR